MATEPEHITQLRQLVKRKTHGRIDGPSGVSMEVDTFSASAVITVYDALKKGANKDKFGKLPLNKAIEIAFKLITK